LRRVGSEDDQDPIRGDRSPDERCSLARGDSVVTGSRVVGAIGGDGVDRLLQWDLLQELREHGPVPDAAPFASSPSMARISSVLASMPK
jgi:hypothetical protein